MTNLWVILFISFLFFLLFRLFVVTLYLICKNVFKLKDEKSGDIFISISLYMVFISSYSASSEAVIKLFSLTNLDLYLSFIILGISSVIWCYFRWSVTSFKTVPKWELPENLKIKRSGLFLVIFIYTLFMGYNQAMNVLYGIPLDQIYEIMNTTVIAAAITFDRFMNQFYKPSSKYKLVMTMNEGKYMIEIILKKEFDFHLSKKSSLFTLTELYKKSINLYYDSKKKDFVYDIKDNINSVEKLVFYIWDNDKQKPILVTRSSFISQIIECYVEYIEDNKDLNFELLTCEAIPIK